jgi:hypothetical protein
VLKVPSNISLMPPPPRAPELNGQENIWQLMRQNWLSNRVFKSFDDIVDHCCYAWNTLIDQPWKIMSIARRGPRTVLGTPQLGGGRGGSSHPHSEQFRSPHKTRLPPCGRLNVRQTDSGGGGPT